MYFNLYSTATNSIGQSTMVQSTATNDIGQD